MAIVTQVVGRHITEDISIAVEDIGVVRKIVEIVGVRSPVISRLDRTWVGPMVGILTRCSDHS